MDINKRRASGSDESCCNRQSMRIPGAGLSFLVHIMIQMLVNRGVGQQVLTSGFVGVRSAGIKLGATQNRVGEKNELLMKKNHRICLKYGGFYGCGGRTRSYDLRVMRGFWVSLAVLNPLKCGELVQVFQSFTGNSEQFSYSPTIVDTPVCPFFDGVLEKVLERNLSVHNRKTKKIQQLFIKMWTKYVKI